MRTVLCSLIVATGLGCSNPVLTPQPPPEAPLPPPQVPGWVDIPVSHPPFEAVEVNWKHRLEQPYLFVEHRGDYRRIGESMQVLLDTVQRHGLTVTGSSFALFFDDPGSVPVTELRARACVPVLPNPGETAGLGLDVLPSMTVVYAVASGAHLDLPRVYPWLYQYMRERNWVEAGPLRETYLVDPGQVRELSQLLTEIQIPWESGAPR